MRFESLFFGENNDSTLTKCVPGSSPLDLCSGSVHTPPPPPAPPAHCSPPPTPSLTIPPPLLALLSVLREGVCHTEASLPGAVSLRTLAPPPACAQRAMHACQDRQPLCTPAPNAPPPPPRSATWQRQQHNEQHWPGHERHARQLRSLHQRRCLRAPLPWWRTGRGAFLQGNLRAQQERAARRRRRPSAHVRRPGRMRRRVCRLSVHPASAPQPLLLQRHRPQAAAP